MGSALNASRLRSLPFAILLSAAFASAYASPQQEAGAAAAEALPEQPSWKSRIWVSGQINLITQLHSRFPAKYSGENSATAHGENVSSRLMSLYLGFHASKNTEFFATVESAGGGGIGSALGIAGFTNVDVVRNPALGQKPYFGRYQVRHVIPLSGIATSQEQGIFSLMQTLPPRRLEIRAGKFSAVDFFDVNAPGSDSHYQFMNWTAVNNGAFDYAADTRGYTKGVMLEYWDGPWTARFAEMLMPKVANGLELDWRLSKAHSEMFELERRHGWLGGGVLRGLSFLNHANMGNYAMAIAQAGAAPPDITAARLAGRSKFGFGVNLEQKLPASLRAFARLGWNDGRNESWAYTEVDGTIAIGGDIVPLPALRKLDKFGICYIANSISQDHRRYLRAGGLGFLLGDGNLTYGREKILEAYYNIHAVKGVYFGLGLQRIVNPGYNQDRGPIVVPSFRLHIELDRENWSRKGS